MQPVHNNHVRLASVRRRVKVLALSGVACTVVALATVLASVLGIGRSPAAHASPNTLVPFQATVSETFTANPCLNMPGYLCIDVTGTGQATHLGDVSEVAHVQIHVAAANQSTGCAPEVRSTTLTAANGDTLTMTGSGITRCTATPNDASDSYTITGGTGRFQGATGSGDENNTHVFIVAPPNFPASGVATVTYSGDISTVGSSK